MEPWLELLDVIDVDDRRAMDTDERLGVELRLHVLHAFAQEVGVALRVDLDVVARRLDPIDLLGPNEEHATARLDDQALRVLPLFMELLEQRDEPRIEHRLLGLGQPATGPLQRLLEARLIERLA